MRRLIALAALLPAVAHAASSPPSVAPVSLGAGLARDGSGAIALAQPSVVRVQRAPVTGSTQTVDSNGGMVDLGQANRRGNISWSSAAPGPDWAIPTGVQLAWFSTGGAAATQASQKVVLPPSPLDGDQVIIGADGTVTVTALAVLDAGGATVIPSMPLYPYSQVIFLYVGGSATWRQRLKVGSFWEPVGSVAAEAQARDAADRAEMQARSDAINAEMNARAQADVTEAQARAAGDSTEAQRAIGVENGLQASITNLSLGCKMQAPQTVSLSVPAVALPAIGLLASTDLTVTGAQLGDQASAAFTTAPPSNLTLSGIQIVAAGKARVTTAATAVLAIAAATLPLKIQLCR